MQAVLNSTRTYQILLALAVLATAFLAFTKASYPQPGGDKSMHILAFFTLSLLTYGAWRRPLWPQWLALAGYGALIELVQWFLPYRESSIHDWYADVVGITLAYGLLALVKWRRSAS
ncbi:VanZ family protein [Gallaecimonas kandeliae]|uniref:VanZ family protein n=1 Tax=Gallaecimonas kandeliae TaxID=3029055 RepID=UPI0026498985|nr:VanZ family protein [Gallaecimonas kandeliae]WKE64900.1 VanZ family protein [Gallaecimonas kandeliae]